MPPLMVRPLALLLSLPWLAACAAPATTPAQQASRAGTQATTPAGAPGDCATPDQFHPVPGLGMACWMGGSRYRVRLDDGSTRITHADPPPGPVKP